MKVLFVHQNFPSQFVHLAAALAAAPHHRVVALAATANAAPPAVEVRPYRLLREPSADLPMTMREEEAKFLRGEACAAAALQLKREGFVPDVIVVHPGWGEGLFLRDVFPQARLVVYCEYYYAAEGQDVGFDAEDPPLTFEQRCRLRLRNSVSLQALTDADAALSPTHWQRGTFPVWARQKIQVIHDGIDYAGLTPRRKASFTVQRADGAHRFTAADKVFSYVARNLEPVRGFHMFMRALPAIQAQAPDAHAIVVGADTPGYGAAPTKAATWREQLLAEVGSRLDLSRVHFVGQLPRSAYLDLLQVSHTHLYWTSPFVLSWSFLEAAASGLPILASATAPVEEFAGDLGVDTLPFFDTQAFADATAARLARARLPRSGQKLERIELHACVAGQAKLLRSL
ncbi:MAG: glycosyltransferase [Telluria sp.]